jgi:periplasmic divalent cation tolerance protein
VEKMSYIIVLITTRNKQEATNIVTTLLEQRLIACANIIDSVSSFFWWKEKIEEEKEVLVIMKSHQKLFSALEKKIEECHSYDVPEILAIPITNGSQYYLDWMKEYLKSVK